MRFSIEVDNSTERIFRFLSIVDSTFTPPLSSRLNLLLYAQKLSCNAVNIFAVSSGVDIGHAAFYANDQLSKKAFLSSISTLPDYKKQGVGKSLMSKVVSLCFEGGMLSISLQVHPDNEVARNFYQGLGFTNDAVNADSMTLVIVDPLIVNL